MRSKDKVIGERLLKLTDGKDYGLCSPPMDAQVALNELCRYFLGENWYTTMPESQKQVNTQIVYEIEISYKGYEKKGYSASAWFRSWALGQMRKRGKKIK